MVYATHAHRSMSVSRDASRERAGPVLVLMPDGDTRIDPGSPFLGHPPAQRLARAASEAGFANIYLAPGTHAEKFDSSQLATELATELATGEWVGRAALVAYESSIIDPGLLALMVEHPLEPGERFSLFDALGRPVGWFTGELARIPAAMPLSEEIPWPEGFGPERVVRVITSEDLPRAEHLILDCELGTPPGQSLWEQHIDLPLMRAFAGRVRPDEQLELGALVCSVGSGALALQGGALGLVCAAFCLLVGVEIARVLPAVGRLREHRFSPGHLVPGAVVRPFGHAALTAALTYVLIAEPTRSSVAGLLLLFVGASAVLLTLAHTRVLLRKQATEVAFALPQPEALASRLGINFPERYSVPLRLEVIGFVFALTAMPELVWGLLVAAGLARLWQWFVAPAKTGEPPRPGPQPVEADVTWDRSAIESVE